MTTLIHEAKFVKLKRHGAEYVENLISGMTLQEQMEFWRRRTEPA